MDVSVIICSKDRKTALHDALESLAAMRIPPGKSLEAVIVDNGSTDGTREMVQAFAARKADARAPVIVYVSEPRRGKSRALNAALVRASGKILAFTDDDCMVAPDWVETFLAEFSNDPGLSGVGGRVELHNPLDSELAVRTSTVRMEITRANFDPGFIPIIGCNMAFRREVFDAIGPFNTDVGPGSRWTLGGDDLDLLYRVSRRGFRVAYCPAMAVSHNHGRRSPAQVASAKKRYLHGRGAFYLRCALAGDGDVVRKAYYEVRSLALGALRGLFRGGAGADLGALFQMAKGALAMMEVMLRRVVRPGG